MARIRKKIACFALFFPFFTLFFRAGSVRLALQSTIAARCRAGRRGFAGPIAIVFKDAALTRGTGSGAQKPSLCSHRRTTRNGGKATSPDAPGKGGLAPGPDVAIHPKI
jgi:hypothetical protein